ncbi:hypothetical protein QLX08_010512 [Tetragonisca angustula]|uniref:Uncharacterized protein n=1 Tax=Tetragonisca angustula TaxID=166442 RepID=A0AAW0ZBW4_9HYME
MRGTVERAKVSGVIGRPEEKTEQPAVNHAARSQKLEKSMSYGGRFIGPENCAGVPILFPPCRYAAPLLSAPSSQQGTKSRRFYSNLWPVVCPDAVSVPWPAPSSPQLHPPRRDGR